ncbi:hypothetical protein G4H71_02035 [Rhodococcus triatomae]|uniref:hypothetical protein n=1 Tax=Rhodococcus triatomae TaxID=300028 RepID=UPI0009328FC9|nr:hypothetical protein [Rhodococcus triatomae]QNG21247.1 hypothetical protein G4H72_06015 [Rhodococcus triatomae]QNG25464.1 hypothetical protein G4H71_02035 [Rhodococcus triatomae]
MSERGLVLADSERADLGAYLRRVLRLDEAAVVRLHRRSERLVTVWSETGFDALAMRTFAGALPVPDAVAAADHLLAALDVPGTIDLGFPMDSSWRGALPPADGYAHVDDVPAHAFVELARRGAELAEEHSSAHGPPASLLDQQVLEIEGAGDRVPIPMRLVFALTAMGFIPSDPPAAEQQDPVRVRASASWVRLDARFGSVYRHRRGSIPLTVTR